jgi:signal transduction histidine kinase/ActR/RegA family two-component response regulator
MNEVGIDSPEPTAAPGRAYDLRGSPARGERALATLVPGRLDGRGALAGRLEVGPFGLVVEIPVDRGAALCLLFAIALAAIAAPVYCLRVARRRAAERALAERRAQVAREAQEAAERANRAKDAFLAVVSHELRTPLVPVLLSAGALLEEDLAPEAREHVEVIRRNVALEARLVDDLLDVSRIERGKLGLELELVDVHEVITRALEVCFAEVFTAEVKVVERLAAAAHHARADHARLMQVFWNVIRNATRYAPSGTTLLIRSFNEPAGASEGNPGFAATEAPEPGGERLVIEFQDSGIGIEPDQLDRIFEPFERGPDGPRGQGAGLGLGLAIARAIAEAHGGRLTAASAGKDRGATFRLELATATAACGGIAGSRSSQRERMGKGAVSDEGAAGLRILLVEDNDDARRYLARALHRHGCQVAVAASLAAARQAAAGTELDLLVSDIELPDGSALELMRELLPRGIAGIAFSGYGSIDDVRATQAVGFSEHLIKPVQADALGAAVYRVASARLRRVGPAVSAPNLALRAIAGSRTIVHRPGGPAEA